MTYLLAVLSGAHAPAGKVKREAHPAVQQRPGMKEAPALFNRGAPK